MPSPFQSPAIGTSPLMPRANWNVLVNYPVAVPPDPILHRFNSYASQAIALIQNLVFKTRNLRHARDLLLPKLVSGEMDVWRLDIRVVGGD